MQCTKKIFGLLSLGKRAATVRRYPAFCFPVCSVYVRFSIPPAVRPTHLRKMDVGSLTCAQFGCVLYTWRGSGTNKSAEELTRRDRKTAPPGDRSQGLRISDALTTELHPPSVSVCHQRSRFKIQEKLYYLKQIT